MATYVIQYKDYEWPDEIFEYETEASSEEEALDNWSWSVPGHEVIECVKYDY